MKKLISILTLLMFPCLLAFGADTKVTALTENSDPAATDLLYMVDDPGGSPLSQKLTVANLALNMPDIIVLGSDLSVGAAGVKLTGDGDGALTLLGLGNGSDEDLTINLDDTSNTIVLTSSTSADLISAAAIGLDFDSLTVNAAAGVDTKTAGTLVLGESTATAVEIADTAVNTSVMGPLIAKEDIQSDEIDSETATALLIGKATATSVTIGASDANTGIAGDLTVTGSDLSIGAAGVKLTGDGDGALTLLGLGDGSDEDLTINLDDTSNTAVVSSSTGVTQITATSIGIQEAYATLVPTAIASLGAATLGKMVVTSDSGNGTDCTTASGTGSNLCMGDGSAFVLVKAIKASA